MILHFLEKIILHSNIYNLIHIEGKNEKSASRIDCESLSKIIRSI